MRKAALGVHLGRVKCFHSIACVGQALKEAEGKINIRYHPVGAQSSQNEKRLGGDRVMNG